MFQLDFKIKIRESFKKNIVQEKKSIKPRNLKKNNF